MHLQNTLPATNSGLRDNYSRGKAGEFLRDHNFEIKPQAMPTLLNSRLTTSWFVHKFGKMQRGIFPQFKVNELGLFPIPRSLATHENSLIAAVDCILSTNQTNPAADTSTEQKVYDLYSRTPEEVAIVEGADK